jgi:hypothetical protein
MNNQLKIQSKKIELIQWLSTIEDLQVLDRIADFIAQENRKDWWDEVSATEKEAIERGLLEADDKKLNPHSKAKEIYGKWL